MHASTDRSENQSTTMEMESDDDSAVLIHVPAYRYFIYQTRNFRQINLFNSMLRGYTLLERSFLVLLGRRKMLISSTIVACALAFMFYWIVGDHGYEDAFSIVAIFAMGTLLTIMMNLQYVFFLVTNHEVIHTILYYLLLLVLCIE